MKPAHTKGFALVEALIVLVVLGALGGVGWYVLSSQEISTQDISVQNDELTSSSDTQLNADNAPIDDVIVNSGSFNGIGTKTGSGSVSIVKKVDGTHILQLGDDFEVQDGPALFVSFGNNGKADHDTLFSELKAISGMQEYEVPSNINIGSYSQVIIYCEEFSVPFSEATIE